ncbi:MAG: hypothetical protein WC480_03270 [Patescibacteria group bacterium]
MLEHLFGSKTRVKLLRLFLNHPDTAYYTRELTRFLDSQINAIRRELANLESMEIIFSFHKDNKGKRHKLGKQEKKYYQINSAHVLYPELRALLLKAHLLLENDLIKRIKKIGAIKYLALTGVFVGFIGAPTDLFVVGNINRDRVTRLVKKFEKDLNYEINYTVMTKTEYKYRKDITDRFLYSILENKKIVVIDEL